MTRPRSHFIQPRVLPPGPVISPCLAPSSTLTATMCRAGVGGGLHLLLGAPAAWWGVSASPEGNGEVSKVEDFVNNAGATSRGRGADLDTSLQPPAGVTGLQGTLLACSLLPWKPQSMSPWTEPSTENPQPLYEHSSPPCTWASQRALFVANRDHSLSSIICCNPCPFVQVA